MPKVRLKPRKSKRILPMTGLAVGLGLAVLAAWRGSDWALRQGKALGAWLVDRGER